jgi:kynurenine formamidase
MARWIYLSYEVDIHTPSYGNEGVFSMQSLRSIDNGDSSNTSCWNFCNHIGTHIDFPSHFYDGGQNSSDYPAAFWSFDRVCLIEDIKVHPEMIINVENLQDIRIPSETQALLIKTGFGKHRGHEKYWKLNPGFSPLLAEHLRQLCPDLRAFGFDCISISSWGNRKLGREAHRAFLNPQSAVLLIEDMDLSAVDKHTVFQKLIVCPLRVAGANGAPCTILGEIKE